jgi:hypothetical protein
MADPPLRQCGRELGRGRSRFDLGNSRNAVVVTDAWLDQVTALTTAKTGGDVGQEEISRHAAKIAKDIRVQQSTLRRVDPLTRLVR